MRDARATQPAIRVGAAATAGGSLLFVAMGSLYAMYGPLLPELADRFRVINGEAALVITGHFAGTVVGILGWMVVAPRLGRRASLMLGAALLAAGASGFAVAPSSRVAIVASIGIGLGFGLLLVGVTSTFAEAYGRRGAAILNLLTAAFGGGAIAGPLAVSAFGADRFRAAYLTGAALAVVGLFLVSTVVASEPSAASAPTLRSIVRAPSIVRWFVVLYICYVAVESGVAGFLATHLLATGVSAKAAEAWTAAFWAAITVGRVLAVPLALRIEPGRIVAACMALAAGALMLTTIDALAPAMYVCAGVALAPVFPTGLAWLSSRIPAGDTTAPSLVIAGAQLGGVAFPAVIGRLIGSSAGTAIPLPLAIAAAAGVAVAITLQRKEVRAGRSKRAASATVTPAI